MASPVQAPRDYRQKLYERYRSTHFAELRPASVQALESELQVWRDYFRPLVPPDRHARILDLGCGCGSFLYFLAREGYRDTAGVDISREQVETAWGLGIENVEQAEAQAYLQKRGSEFDCIVALDLLEHCTKDEVLRLLEAVHRALKPGGTLLLRAPNADGPFGTKILYSDFTHQLAFTPSSLRQVLARCGFAQVEIYPEGPRVHGLVSTLRWLAWQALSLGLRLCLAAETGRFGGHLLTQNLIARARKPQNGRRNNDA